MVDSNRLTRRLPSLLIPTDTTTKKGWRGFMRTRYRLAQFKKRNPEKYNMIINKLVNDLNELDKEVNT